MITVCCTLLASYALSAFFGRSNRRKIPELRQRFIEVMRAGLGNFAVPELALPPYFSIGKLIAIALLLCIPISLFCFGLYAFALFIAGQVAPEIAAAPVFRASLSVISFVLFAFVILPILERAIIFSKASTGGSQAPSDTQLTLFQCTTTIETLGLYAYFLAILALGIFNPTPLPLLSFIFPCYLLGVLLVILWNRGLINPSRKFVSTKLAQADYEQALVRARLKEAIFSRTAVTLYELGSVLLFSGRAAEAEPILRDSLMEGLKTGQMFPATLTNYGYALTRLGRFDEAARFFEEEIKRFPKLVDAYRGLAETYLFQGHQPELALEVVRKYIGLHKADFQRAGKSQPRSSLLADEAWALAMQGHHYEARRSLGLALGRAPNNFKPGLAGINYKAGQVMRLKGATKDAAHYFETARQLDSNGAFGQLATQALDDLGTDATPV